MYRPPASPRQHAQLPWPFWALVAALVITSGVTLYLIYTTYVAAPAPSPATETANAAATAEAQSSLPPLDSDIPLQKRNAPDPQPWDGKSRINILLLGVDDRTWQTGDGPPRTDTIILATINPANNTIGMLSLPRDLWVEVPGQGYYKINQAFPLGEAEGLDGGGAGLAMATVEQFLNVEIPFYVQVNFDAFVTLIDEIGGVKVNVPAEITIDPLGDGNTRKLQPGVQTLPGDLALAYVRNRNTTGGDFDRAARQQQVLIALLKRLTDFDLLPTLLRKAPALYQQVASGVSTNLTWGQLLTLGKLAYQIPPENIKNVVIDLNAATASTNFYGQYILIPIPEKIEALKASIFAAQPSPFTATPWPTAALPPTDAPPTITPVADLLASPTPAPLSGPSVIVQNGTFISGLATQTASLLQSYGVNVIEASNADGIYDQSLLIDYTGNQDTIARLREILEKPDLLVFNRYDPDPPADILLIIGADW